MGTTDIEIVPTVIFELPDRQAYLDAYFHQGALGGLFVPGHLMLRPGTEVQLQILFGDAGPTFRARGIVRWRRAQTAGGLVAGIGVEFLDSEKSTRDLLLEYAHGREVRVLQRRARRLPVRLQVEYATASAFLTDMTDDISEGGVFILSDDPPEVGAEVKLRLKPPGRFFAIKLRGEVAWRKVGDRSGFGVRFIFDKATTERKIRELVDDLRDHVTEELDYTVPRGRARMRPKR